MTTLSDIEKLIDEHRDISDVGQRASDELIAKAERFLNLQLPKDYREFLRKWGTLSVGPMEFYGITSGNFESASIPNAIWLTQVKRRHGLPAHLVILYNNDGDEYFCLDTTDPSQSPVVIWDAVTHRIRGKKSQTLFDFILAESKEAISIAQGD